MAQQRVLFVDAESLTAYHWTSGELRVETDFLANEAGFDAFESYLRGRRSSLFSLLADVTDEGFQTETVPYVQGRDRVALIKRKLGQLHYGTPFSAAIPQGREKSGRRDERLLFVGLTRPQQFEPWLALLRQSESQLTGLYSIPLLAAALIESVANARPHLLLVSFSRAGLRQTFFEQGRLRFSRLSPLTTDSVEEAAIAAAAESAKLYQYLAGQRLVERDTPLPVQLLAHPADLDKIRAYCRDNEELHFENDDLLQTARKAGLKTLPTDSRAELLFIHLLAKKLPRQQFAPPPERHYYHLWQLRFAINSAAAVVVLACLLWSGRQWFEISRLEDNTAQMQIQAAADRQRYDEAMVTLPPVPMSADNLRALIGRFDELEKRSASLTATYVRISNALQVAPAIELESIDWKLSANPDEGPQTPGSAAPGAASGTLFAVADIHGGLPVSMLNDQRAQLDAVNTFADRLRSGDAAQVRVLSMPLDIESGKTLRSDSTPSAAAAIPRFSLRLLQKL